MPTDIGSLPPEILHEIFSDRVLECKDLCNASRVCKAFASVAQRYLTRDGDIVLYHNDQGQLVSLIRNLLLNESFRGRFTKVEIDWSDWRPKRRLPIGRTWRAHNYHWTVRENTALRRLFDENDFNERWRSAVVDIVEPAALILPILCLFTNLHDLDIGKPNTGSLNIVDIYSEFWETHLEEALHRMVPGRVWGSTKRDLDHQALISALPKGLQRLKIFTRGYHAYDEGFGTEDIISILMLPTIETVDCSTFGGDFHILSRFNDIDLRCRVKRIDFHELECRSQEVAKLLRFCEALEVVNVSLVYIGIGIVESEDEMEEGFAIEPMQQALMDQHKETLQEVMLEAQDTYWWFKRVGQKARGGWKPTWWGNEDWDD
ncbi:hypothetical protein ABW21_db0202465 [Orbilia brochopaga]|nr:hypothetical protein ABW21_db0202465 [Drechslerella brochopaga]